MCKFVFLESIPIAIEEKLHDRHRSNTKLGYAETLLKRNKVPLYIPRLYDKLLKTKQNICKKIKNIMSTFPAFMPIRELLLQAVEQ